MLTFKHIRKRPLLSAPLLIFIAVVWISLVNNLALWQTISERLTIVSATGFGYVLTLFALMVFILVTPLLLFAQHLLLKPLLILLLLATSTLAYFSQKLGVVYDIEMIRNIVETIHDRNTMETVELMSLSLFLFVMTTSLAPILLVLRTKVKRHSFAQSQLRRIGWWGSMAVMTIALVLINFKQLTYFSRENNDLEMYLNPLFPIMNISTFLKGKQKAKTLTFNKIGQDAAQIKNGRNRTVGVMVVGETARADHFSLNGYHRETNPGLTQQNIVNFSNVTSCGTSTAFSVPCMFSLLDQAHYTPELAASQSNVLDVLQSAGVKTVWVDSNSSCKGVCARIESINIIRNPDQVAPTPKNKTLFVEGAWHDEILNQQLDHYLDSTNSDILIILHSMGSHGPAYYRRYPDTFAKFQPFCNSKAPQDCSKEEIINAYDNTILYTDFVLTSILEKLEQRSDNSFMLYASDHGESLGENGIYLHGLPRILAPAAQTEIPMLAWFSDGFLVEHPIGVKPAEVVQDDQLINHDYISASLLGLFDVNSSVYRPELDLFKPSDNELTPIPYAASNIRQLSFVPGNSATNRVITD